MHVTLAARGDGPEYASRVATTADGLVTTHPLLGEDDTFAFDVHELGPSSWLVDVAFDYWTGSFALDVTTLPLDAPVDWYPDGDGDGYGDPLGVSSSSTVPVAGASPDARDCDDADPFVRPNGPETCGDGLDQDCDGADRVCSPESGETAIAATGTRFTGDAGSFVGEWLAAGDLDGDGVTDLVASGQAGFVRPVSRTDTQGASGLILPPSPGGTIGDLTGDGIGDLALISLTEPVVLVHAGPIAGALDLAPAARVDHGAQIVSVAAGDATGEGIADLVVVGLTEISVYAGPMAGNPAVDRNIPARFDGLSRPAVAFGDADGDGLDDVWTHDVCLFLSPVGSVAEGCTDDGDRDNLTWAGMTSLDANGDGLADLAVGSGEGAFVFLGPLSGDHSVADAAWFTALEPRFSNVATTALVPDRDGDGAAELVLATVEGEEAWSVSLAGGGVVDRSAATEVWTGLTHPSLLGADLDRDGSGDVVFGDPFVAQGTDWSAGAAFLSWGP